jgi:hypothetical protein
MGEHIHHPGSYSNDGLWDEVFIRMVVRGLGGRQFVDRGVVNSDSLHWCDERGDLMFPTKDDDIRQVIYVSAALVADEVVAFRKERRS